jgi:hypothetical protein
MAVVKARVLLQISVHLLLLPSLTEQSAKTKHRETDD